MHFVSYSQSIELHCTAQECRIVLLFIKKLFRRHTLPAPSYY
jgi:hypothetical protein